MFERSIIAAFALGSIGVHYLIYLWVMFKVDEGLIIQLFSESHRGQALSTKSIASLASISESRAKEVCAKSASIEPYLEQQEIWHMVGSIRA